MSSADNGTDRKQYVAKLEAELEEVREQLSRGSLASLQQKAKKQSIKMVSLVGGEIAIWLILVGILYVWAVFIDPPVDKVESLLRVVGLTFGALAFGYVARVFFKKYRSGDAAEQLHERARWLQQQIDQAQAQSAEVQQVLSSEE